MTEDSKREPPAPGALGFMLVALVLICGAAGYGLDRWLHATPWLMVAGIFVGFGLGLGYVVLTYLSNTSGRGGGDPEDDGDGSDEGAS